MNGVRVNGVRVNGARMKSVTRSGDSPRGRDSRRDQGSVLVLVPAGLLVLMILAVLAVDSAVAYLGQQQLHDALSAAANDAVTRGLNEGSFYSSGMVALEPASVGQAICDSVLAQDDTGLHQLHLWMAIDGESVRIEGTAVIDAVFGRAIPGFGTRMVRSFADAVVTSGPLRGSSGPAESGVAMTPLDCTAS
jgi:hypothetical protein